MAQRIIWTCKLVSDTDQANHKTLAKHFFGKYRNTHWGLDVLKLDLKLSSPNCDLMPKFYFECLQAWKLMKPTTPNPVTKHDILNEPLFDNPKITNLNRNGQASTIFIKSLVDVGIVTIKNVCNGRHFVTPQNVANFAFPDDRTNRSRIRTKYDILISCIPQEWINVLKQDTQDKVQNSDQTFTLMNPNLNAPLVHTKATTSVVYKALIKSHNPPISQRKWEDVLNMSPEWNLVWNCAKHKSLDKYLCDLNWRLLHRALKTNKRLFQWGVIQNPLCEICKNNDEDLLHCIVSCPHAFNLWLYVKQILSSFLRTNVNVNLETIILGLYQFDDVNYQIANFCISAAKFAIWSARNAVIFNNETKNTKCIMKSLIINRIKQQTASGQNIAQWSKLQECL